MNNTRQMAVVMFSDVVGYTALMGENEASALALLQKYHPIQKSLIENHGGTFVKEIGDGLLAYFQTADSAAQCCHEIQKRVAEESDLSIRIGLNQAEIILEKDDIYGDGVNIASRIEALADPGGIYFSEEVANAMSESLLRNAVIMGKAKLKNVKTPVTVYALQGEGLPIPSKSRFQELANPKRKLAAIPALVIFFGVIVAIIVAALNYFDKQAQEEEARNSLAEVEQLVQSSWRDYGQAYDRALELQKIIPGDPAVKALIEKSSVKINVITEPGGAEVFIKRYDTPTAPWESIGVTPIDSLQLPITVFRWRIVLEGYETLYATETSFDLGDFRNMEKVTMLVAKDFIRKMDSVGSIPTGMTRVTGSAMPYGKLDDFFIDKYEVANQEYQEFVAAGAYENEQFWDAEFIKDGKKISWEEAMALFKDKTGLPGPSTWSNGTYPAGSGNFPVSGISWYEALAYARHVRKDLPTGDHWGLARGESTFIIRWPQMGGYALFAPFSNFNHAASVEVGSLDGMTSYGAYDMAGNVREWCLNDAPMGKLVRGGSWNSNTYEFSLPSQAPAFDRSETNGFRCALYLQGEPLPEPAYRISDVSESQIYQPTAMEPISDEVFEIYSTFYDYDHTPLNAEVVTRDQSKPNWIQEKITFGAAYNDEKVIAHLFLPKNAKPPYQTVLYGPGSASFFQANSDHIDKYYEFPVFLEYIVKSGRAVLFPIVQGTFERRTDLSGFIHLGSDTHQYTEFLTQVVKDYRRTIDYLETRKDIDSDNISFYGMSWGPTFGTILSSVEKRIKTNVFISGGFRGRGRPEVNSGNFIPRVTVPTLMVNGKYDSILPYELYIEPMFRNLATPEKDKRLAMFDTDHIPPRDGMISETLGWFDKYMGEVNLTADPPS